MLIVRLWALKTLLLGGWVLARMLIVRLWALKHYHSEAGYWPGC